MFTITAIHIGKDCRYRKNLKEETTYELGHRIDKNFYAPNICLSAIVGQNGAGKSSLLDMMLRIINNFSYCLFSKIPRNAAAPLSYIMEINADLYFITDKTSGAIKVRDGIVAYEYGDLKIRFVQYRPHYQNAFLIDDIFPGYENGNDLSSDKIRGIAESFFYTIATNYSMQAFVARDYAQETAVYTKEGEEKSVVVTSWINNLFHKNDGYVCPIVLNPYRNDGWIDMNTEEQLTITRLSALLLEEKDERSVLDGYEFIELEAHYHPRTMPLKFHSIVDENVSMFTEEDCEKEVDLVEFEKYALNKKSYTYAILSALRCGVKKNMPRIQLYVRMYVVYKVLSIAEKYPYYAEYKRNLGNISYVFTEVLEEGGDKKLKEARDLAIKVKNDPSHIGLKLRQALNFIRKGRDVTDLDITDVVTYDKYAELLGIPRRGMTIEKRMEWLPPGIFHTDIKVRKKGNEKDIPLNQLSSGERQFIYQTSTLVYHALNLKSVPKTGTRIRYNKLNFILDEVEICFHPEYQRVFIKRLVDLLVRLQLNKAFDINILLTTHSPFVLSDIPKQNILYLEDGERSPMSEQFKQTFAANIGDLLHQSFFLKKGFMGAVAQDKLQTLSKILKKVEGSGDMSYEEMKCLVDMVGDDLLHQHFTERLREHKNAQKATKKMTLTKEERLLKIKQLEAEIEQLKKDES